MELRHQRKGPSVEIDSTTHDRLINWAEWFRDRRYFGHCDSIEWRYRPERIPDNEERSKEQIRPQVNVRDALKVERVVSGVTFPRRQCTLIKSQYLGRAVPQAVCRKLGIRFSEFGQEMGRAVAIVRNRLKLLDNLS